MINLKNIKFIFIQVILFFALSLGALDNYDNKEFKLTIKPSGNNAILSLILDEDVKTYWRNSGEVGLPTKISFIGSENLRSAKVLWPVPELNQAENIISYVYQGKQDFLIQLEAKNSNKEILLKARVNLVICKASCSNHEINLSTKILPSVGNVEKAEWIQALTKTPSRNGDEDLTIQDVQHEVIANQDFLKIYFSSNSEQISPKLFIDLPSYINFYPDKITLMNSSEGQVIALPIEFLEKKKTINNIYLNLVADNGHAIEYETSENEEKNYSFGWILFCALFGGLILNVMPCVLPILALKAIHLTKLAGKDKVIIRKSLLAQALGIIFSFVILAIITYALKQFGEYVGFGIQFQQPSYLITMTLILSLIAINLVEAIDLNIYCPEFITKALSLETNGFVSFFLSGVLVTMLAVPCTAPFITIAIGFAITADFLGMLIIFSLIGFGMSIPYLAMAAHTKVNKLLPKPGLWMEKFKKYLGLLIFATSIWLIYIISTQLGNKAAITLFLLIILIKFVLTEKQLLTKNLKVFFIILLFGLCYIIPYNLYEEKHQVELLIENVWQDYDPGKIKSLIAEDHIVLLDVTASWCATCKLNKITTLDNTIVMDFMRKRGIIGMRADISAGNTPEISSLMKFHKHYGIPLCIVYSKKFPTGIVMPTFLTPNILISSFKKASD